MTALAAAVTGRIPRSIAPAAVGVAAAGICLLVGLVDPARTALFPPCPFKAVTGGLDCPGCGATRGLHQLLNGNVVGAVDYNALFVLALPLALWSWLAWAVPARRLPMPRFPTKAVYAIGGLLLAWWVSRNLPFMPFEVLHSDR